MKNNSFMKWIMGIAFTLLVIGGLNWLLVGLFEFDLVAAIFGMNSIFSRIIYTLVGISAITLLGNVLAKMIMKTSEA
jgi:uncharacterized membrane protein YuzA (DUF378 family)